MLVLISYDVATITDNGKKRLRKVAKICQNFGIRVQNSVFECNVNSAQLVELKAEIAKIYNPSEDSVRYYNLGNKYQNKIEHYGTKIAIDVEQPLII